MNWNTVLFTDQILGEITFSDFAYYIDYLLEQNQQNINILDEMFHEWNIPQDTIDYIIHLINQKDTIQFIQYCLDNILN